MEVVTADDAAKNLSQLIHRIHEEGQQYRITVGEKSAVLFSYETYLDLIVTLELLATPELMKDVKFLDPQVILS